MTGIIIAQVAMILFALFSAPEEGHYTWPFRMIREEHFSREDKKKHSAGAHKWGYAGVIIVGIAMGLLAGFVDRPESPWGYGAVAALLCGVCYGLLFDPGYALFIGKKWYYVGNPKSDDPYNSSSDDIVNRVLGKDAGKKKAAIFLGIVAGLNFLLLSW